MYNIEDEIPINKEELVRQPRKYNLKHPKYLLFVDEEQRLCRCLYYHVNCANKVDVMEQ
jgi:hypothetical protein